MPNRILRDWTDSEKIHLLSSEAERFFTRLIMKADDYGRYVANIKLLRSNLFPLFGRLKDEKVAQWLKECEDADLVFIYEVNGKRYLEIKLFDQKLRIRKSKYPPSDEEYRRELQEGYVYLIGTDYKKPVKVGFSVNPWARLKELTVSNHSKLEVLLTIKSEKTLERSIHKAIKECRVKNEWFQLTPDMVNTLIELSNGLISIDNCLDLLRSISSLLRSSTETETEVETESETEVEAGKPPAHTNEQLELFKNFQKWVLDNAPNVARLKEPFTIDEYFKIKNRFTREQVSSLILKMGNYKPLTTKSLSAYRTFLNWAERDYDIGKVVPLSSGPSPAELQAKRILNEVNAGK